MKKLTTRVYYAISNRLNSFGRGIRRFYFLKVIRKPYYYPLTNSQLITNWFFQRVFRLNKDVPFSLAFTSRIQGADKIKINGNPASVMASFAVSGGCYFTIFNGTTLEIGEKTIWSTNVCIQTGNHDLYDREKYTVGSVRIGKNCWIGTSVTILPGVELGDNVTIGANSVVTKSFPSNCVIAGVPAKTIKIIQ